MQTVPKIVRERLKAAPFVGNHPDTDVLTAFAERSLPELERAVVLEHVARCGDCRDVVALALPETELSLPVASPAHTPWLTWPVVRWGFVTAGVIAIASVGIMRYQRRPEMTRMAANESVSRFPAPPQASNGQPTQFDRLDRDKSSSTAPPGDSLYASASPKLAEQRLQPNHRPAPSTLPSALGVHGAFVVNGNGAGVGGSVAHGPRMPAQGQQQSQAQAPSTVSTDSVAISKQQAAGTAANNIPSVSETVEVQASAPLMQTETSQTAILPAPANGQQSPARQSADDVEFKVDKAKAATPSSTETTQATTVGGPGSKTTVQSSLETVVLEARAIAPRWAITSAGGLQRSVDGGDTWQNVDVNAATALNGRNFTSLEVVESTRTRKKDEKKARQSAIAASPAPVFRAVAVTGNDVWAGGSSGVLYHSLDAGVQWVIVVPVSGGVALTGDIVGVEFSDTQHGKITTSAGKSWITADDGQSWQKQ
jgi:hypothetical protein